MKKFSLIICVFFSVNLFSVTVLQNVDNAYGTIAMPFKNILPSAKALGIGGAYTAIANDGFATLYNPAVLSQKNSHSIIASFAWLQYNRFFINAAYIVPFNKFGSLSAGASLFLLSGIEERDTSGVLSGKSLAEFQGQAFLGYGIEIIKGLSLGLRGDFLFDALTGSSIGALGYNFGVGMHYKFNTENALRFLRLALVVDNIPGFNKVPQVLWLGSASNARDNLSMNIKLGASYGLINNILKITGEFILFPGLVSKDNSLKTFIDYSIGMELNYKMFTFRMGGNHTRYSGGIGLIVNKQVNIDYAFSWDWNLGGMIHMFTAGVQFGGRIEEEKRAQIMQDIINNRAIGAYEDGMFEFENGRYETALKYFNMAALWDPMLTKADDMAKKTKDILTKAKTKESEVSVTAKEVKKEEIQRIEKGFCPSAKQLLKLYYDGINAFMQGDISKALANWNEVLRCDPDNDKVKLNIKKAEMTLRQMKGGN